MNTVDIRTLEKQLATKKALLKTLQEKCQLQNKKIKLLRKENQQLKNNVEKQNHIDTNLLLHSKELSDQNSKLEITLEELERKLKQPTDSPGPATLNIANIIVNQDTQEIDLPQHHIVDQDILQLSLFPNIKTLILGQNKLTNTAVSMICNSLTSLKKLFLNNNNFTSQSLQNIYKLQQLKQLDIRGNILGNQCLLHISKLVNLNQLSISKNQINDEGTQYLPNLHQLLYLDITNNKISDEGIKNILKLKKLLHLYLNSNHITSLGVRWVFKDMKLAVFDARFNNINNEDRENLKNMKPKELQLFV